MNWDKYTESKINLLIALKLVIASERILSHIGNRKGVGKKSAPANVGRQALWVVCVYVCLKYFLQRIYVVNICGRCSFSGTSRMFCTLKYED